MWVTAAEMRPGNSKVLHHGKVWVRPPGSKWMAKACLRRSLREREPSRHHGRQRDRGRQRHPRQVQSRASARSGSTWKAPPSSSRRDRTSCSSCTTRRRASRRRTSRKLGLVLAKEAPQTRYFFHAGPTAMNLAIPAGDGNAEVVSEITFGEDARLVYAQPHMHLRGKDFELRVVTPDEGDDDGAEGRRGTSTGRWATSTRSR